MKFRKRGHKEVSETATAFAGLGAAIGVITAFLAWLWAPTGIAALLVGVGLLSAPFIVRVSPVVGAIVAGVAAIAGLARFYSWLRERLKKDEGAGST